MKNSSWKDYAEIIGIAAIVASLIFVGLQMRQDRVIALATVQAAFLESFVEIRRDKFKDIHYFQAKPNLRTSTIFGNAES